jgi:hypothetical protein
VWFYVCYFLATSGAIGTPSLVLQAPVALLFSLWIAVGNRRVAVVLDPELPTKRLQERILEERRRGWSAEEDQPPAVH